MTTVELQSLCEVGQQQLMAMDYLAAEASLIQAEQAALEMADFDTLARLYMPLQETRRQRRQRCGEGIVHLHLLATGRDDPLADPTRLIEEYPQGQLLIAGSASLNPAIRFRELAAQRRLYVETYLAAVYQIDPRTRAVVIVPLPDVELPPLRLRAIDELLPLLPANSIVLSEEELPTHSRVGDPETYARTMSLWEQLHTPFLNAADALTDPIEKMDGYRKAIAVDYACELAHQRLSAAARDYARKIRGSSKGVPRAT